MRESETNGVTDRQRRRERFKQGHQWINWEREKAPLSPKVKQAWHQQQRQMSSEPSESLNSPLSCVRAASPPGSACSKAEVGFFVHTPLDGGHTSHRVTSTHRALDQLPAESQTHFQRRGMREWAKGYRGSFSKTLCELRVNSLGSNAHQDLLLKGATLALNYVTAIRGTFLPLRTPLRHIMCQ